MVEVDGTVRNGKDVNRAAEGAFVNGLEEFRGAEVKSLAVDEEAGVAFVEWFMDYRHKAGAIAPATRWLSRSGTTGRSRSRSSTQTEPGGLRCGPRAPGVRGPAT
jgi:hypothetical protein